MNIKYVVYKYLILEFEKNSLCILSLFNFSFSLFIYFLNIGNVILNLYYTMFIQL
jgi:hypothetical protein